jgi:hypothetical protein
MASSSPPRRLRSGGSLVAPAPPKPLTPAELAQKGIDDLIKYVAEDPATIEYESIVRKKGAAPAPVAGKPMVELKEIFSEMLTNPDLQTQKDKSKLQFDRLQEQYKITQGGIPVVGIKPNQKYVSCKEDYEVALFPVCKKLQAALTVSLKDLRDTQTAKIKAANPIKDPATLRSINDKVAESGLVPKPIIFKPDRQSPRFQQLPD